MCTVTLVKQKVQQWIFVNPWNQQVRSGFLEELAPLTGLVSHVINARGIANTIGHLVRTDTIWKVSQPQYTRARP